MLGTNNIVRDVHYPKAPELLSRLIDVVAEACPDAAILVGTITPLVNPEWEKKRNQYNQALSAVVAKLAESGKRVSLVDMDAVEAKHINANDHIHPTDAGYEILAERWYEGIKTAGRQGWIQKPVHVTTVVNQSGSKGGDTHKATAQAEDLKEEGKAKAKAKVEEQGKEEDKVEQKATANEQAEDHRKPDTPSAVLDSQPVGPVKPMFNNDIKESLADLAQDDKGKQTSSSTLQPPGESQKQGDLVDLPNGVQHGTEDPVPPRLISIHEYSGGRQYLGLSTMLLTAFALRFRRQIFGLIMR
jgi:hypothetical protein